MGEDKSRQLAEDRIPFYYLFQGFPTPLCNWAYQQLHLSRTGSPNDNRTQWCKKKKSLLSLKHVCFHRISVISHPMIYFLLKNQQYYLHEIWLWHITPQIKGFSFSFFSCNSLLTQKNHRSFFPYLWKAEACEHFSHLCHFDLYSFPLPLNFWWCSTKIQQSLTHTLWTSGFLYTNQTNLTQPSQRHQHSSLLGSDINGG